MNKLLAILLSIALYAPHIANILSYTECMVVAASTISEKQSCGCNLNNNTNQNDRYGTLPHKQNKIDFKTDWQVAKNDKFQYNNDGFLVPYLCLLNYNQAIIKGFAKTVFRPPSY